jgi:hypothetical protein
MFGKSKKEKPQNKLYYFDKKSKERYFRQKNFDDVAIGKPINLILNPYNNRNWQHSFVSLRWLISDLISKNKKDNKEALEIIEEFLDWMFTPNTTYWYGCGDHTTAIRLDVLMLVRKLTKKHELKFEDNNYQKLLDSAIKQHVKRLNSPKLYNPNHNHGVICDLSLIKAYKSWSSLAPKGRGIDFIANRMIQTIKNICDKNWQAKEHSITYQMTNCFFAIDAYKSLEKLSPSHARKLEKIIKPYAKVTEIMFALATKKKWRSSSTWCIS